MLDLSKPEKQWLYKDENIKIFVSCDVVVKVFTNKM